MKSAYSYTPRSLTRDGKPFLPIMGEFHYSRYPARYWARELEKIRAGGVSIVASYVIWLHHEEEQGKISFDGNLNLRRFVELAGEAGLKYFVRIGPWVHAETRNGGFPDWVLQQQYRPRTNDERYFADVQRFYKAIYEQLEGLFHGQGGPIIGIQIENEYGHVGGLSGEEAERHMRRLRLIAEEVGFAAPYWTATAWGGAYTGGMLPVMGGYPDSPWDPRTTKIEPSTNFVFSPQRNDHAIGSDHGVKESINFDPALFPYLTAELGGGLQVTAHRRPVATGRDIEAMSIAKLASGASLLGYYMYHGGTNPRGRLSTFQESKASGYPNDLPIFNYDFNAPLGEYGQMRESYFRLRRLALFFEDFGESLADMKVEFAQDNPDSPEDMLALRQSVRSNEEGSGYLFAGNYQRLYARARHAQKVLCAKLNGDEICFPPVDIEDGDYFFWPCNIAMAGGVLRRACATPLCVLHTKRGMVPVFYSGDKPDYEWTKPSENPALTLGEEAALFATRIVSGGFEHLLLFVGSCYKDEEGGYKLECEGNPVLRVFPPLDETPQGFVRGKDDASGFAQYKAALPDTGIITTLQRMDDENGEAHYRLHFDYVNKVAGALLRIKATYNTASLYVRGEFVGDSFYSGQDWEIDLERYDWPDEIDLHFTPLVKTASLYLERWPELPQKGEAKIHGVSITPVHSFRLFI